MRSAVPGEVLGKNRFGAKTAGGVTAQHSVDNKTLEAFLSDVERRALRMAEIATGQHEEALDIVQDAMLQLVHRYGRREPADWGPLFHRILQNRIRDWYRRQGVRQRVLAWWVGGRHEAGDADTGVDPLDRMPDPARTGPEQDYGDSRFAADLDAALHALPLRQQQAFLLRAWEGLDVAETACAMGISSGSVKTHYSRALSALRTKLEAYQP